MPRRQPARSAGWPASLSRVPRRNAGPSGIRSCRPATLPVVGPAIATQLPLVLLCRLFHRAARCAVLTPACSCAPDPVPPAFRHSRPARTGISQMPGPRQEQSPAIVRQHLQVHIADGILSDSPAPARGPASGRAACREPGTQMTSTQARGWRRGPGELSRGGCAARMAHPAGVTQVRAVRRDATGGHASRDK